MQPSDQVKANHFSEFFNIPEDSSNDSYLNSKSVQFSETKREDSCFTRVETVVKKDLTDNQREHLFGMYSDHAV